MRKEEIHLNDWARVFLGEVPPEFYIEVVIRMAFLYVLLVTSMRLIGKRMSSQFTQNELAALVSLAAAIGVPILSPDRGLLPAVVIAFMVVSINRLMSLLPFKNEKAETVLQGDIEALVKDGVMQIGVMTRTRITRERLMAQLRSEKIIHLGEVKRLFIEANGSFTLIKNDQPLPGLSALPEEDEEFNNRFKKTDALICKACGMENPSFDHRMACPNCESKEWVSAVHKELAEANTPNYALKFQNT
jgi:uncharacterized membrane protein YcaP (DUF421 family)